MATELKPTQTLPDEDYRHGYHDSEAAYNYKSGKGLSRETVASISAMKKEPEWMLQFRLKALRDVPRQADADSGATRRLLDEINFDDIHYFVKLVGQAADARGTTSRPTSRSTFDRLGIPEAERKFLVGRLGPVRIRGRLSLRARGSDSRTA